MMKNIHLYETTLRILSTQDEMSKWDLIRAVGQELNVRRPVYNPLFRMKLMARMWHLTNMGEVTLRRGTEKVAGMDVTVLYYRRASLAFDHP